MVDSGAIPLDGGFLLSKFLTVKSRKVTKPECVNKIGPDCAKRRKSFHTCYGLLPTAV